MKSLKYSEILAANRELNAKMCGEMYQIAILSNIIVSPLEEILEFGLRRRGINAEVLIGEYDNIVQDSTRFSAVKAVVIFWEASNFIDGFHSYIESYDDESIDRISDRVIQEIRLVLDNLEHVPLVLINSFSSLLFSFDDLRDGPLKKLCRKLNGVLTKHARPNRLIVDLNSVLARVGLDRASDFRQFQSSKALYTIDFFKHYVETVEPAFRAATGHVKKVIVLDCDNTLWGGILGEDGEDGIQIDDTTLKGKVFREVQHTLKGLQKKGVLLSICSKNNPVDVENVLATHPDMVLRSEDFVAKKVNWANKALNIQELALELNLGPDSFVFIDDSSFELGLIEKELPGVTCAQVPKTLSEYPNMVRKLSRQFFSLSRTDEDTQKTEQYKQEFQRKNQAKLFDTVEDYLASLDLRLHAIWGNNISVARASQMTQKTNQFNLTTRRYTEGDISSMLANPTYILSMFSLKDCYGDYGITGLIVIEKEQPSIARIDSFLMSCRVIGRNVEFAFFDWLVKKLGQKGIKTMKAEYTATKKNGQVYDFFESLGFHVIGSNETGKMYSIPLEDYRPRNIPYINIIEKDAGHE